MTTPGTARRSHVPIFLSLTYIVLDRTLMVIIMISMSQHVSHAGRAELEEKPQANTANLSIGVDYTNYTNGKLYFKTQRNIPFAVCNEEGLHVPRDIYPHLKITVTYTIHDSGSMEDTLRLIDAIIQNDFQISEETQILRQKIKDKLSSNLYYLASNKTVSFSMSRTIRQDDLYKAGVLYIPETGIVVTMDREKITTPHPYSPEGLQNIEHSQVLENVGQSGIMIKVVDNDQISPMRYYYAGKRLICVGSIVDQRRESGVYITICDRDNERNVKFVTFKEAEDLIGLFKTQDEALTHGDPKQMTAHHAREIENHNLNLENINLSLKNESVANKAKLQEREAELAALKHNLNLMRENIEHAALVRKHTLDSVGDRRKDHFEERSYYRKDSSEAWKFVPLVVGVVVGVAGYLFGKR